MYLWSIDIDAVLTGMSCFHLLCEEADIMCGSDEMAVTQILPNYNVYADIAQASTVLTTGRHRREVPSNGSLFVFASLGCAYVMLYRHFILLKWKQTWSACVFVLLYVLLYANKEDETFSSGFCNGFKDLIHRCILDILGRAALQKRIMALLRKIDQHTSGNSQVKYFCRHFLLDFIISLYCSFY